MAKRKPRTKEQALDDLTTLMRDIFPYLHLDYRDALAMAMRALEREAYPPPKGEERFNKTEVLAMCEVLNIIFWKVPPPAGVPEDEAGQWWADEMGDKDIYITWDAKEAKFMPKDRTQELRKETFGV